MVHKGRVHENLARFACAHRAARHRDCRFRVGAHSPVTVVQSNLDHGSHDGRRPQADHWQAVVGVAPKHHIPIAIPAPKQKMGESPPPINKQTNRVTSGFAGRMV